MYYIIEVRDVNSEVVLGVQQMSGDAGSLKRRILAERIAKSENMVGFSYALEFEVNKDTGEQILINKYEIYF